MTRFFFLTLLCGLLTAQQPPSSQTQTTMPHINSTVRNVIAPVWVYDAEGNYVNGLGSDQFHLYDNSKDQNIKVDEAFEPISMVTLLQANSAVEHMQLANITVYAADMSWLLNTLNAPTPDVRPDTRQTTTVPMPSNTNHRHADLRHRGRQRHLLAAAAEDR